MRFTANNWQTRLLIAAIIGLLALGAWRANASEGLSVGAGIVTIGADRCDFESVVLSQEFGDRRWLGTLAIHGTGNCRGEKVRANFGAGVARITHPFGRLTVGLGVMLQEHADIGSLPAGAWQEPRTVDRLQLCAQILIRVRLTRRLSGDLVHCSSGGATVENPGKNFAVLSARF